MNEQAHDNQLERHEESEAISNAEFYHAMHDALIASYTQACDNLAPNESAKRHLFYEVLKTAQAALRSQIEALGLSNEDLDVQS